MNWKIGKNQSDSLVTLVTALIGFLALGWCDPQWVAADDLVVDVLLWGGEVIDGTGGPVRTADAAILDGKIVMPNAGDTVTAKWKIDCRGLVVCPGFIDLHNHSMARWRSLRLARR